MPHSYGASLAGVDRLGPSRDDARNDKAANNRAARAANEKWYPDHAVMNVTKDQLKAMPEFKYSSYN